MSFLAEIAPELVYDIAKWVIKRAPTFKTRLGEVNIIFNIIVHFYKRNLISIAEKRIDENLNKYLRRNNLVFNKSVFEFKINWDFYEEEKEFINDEPNELMPYVNINSNKQYVKGFSIRLVPIPPIKKIGSMLIDGYNLMESIILKLKRDTMLMNRKYNEFISIIADKQVNENIETKYKKKLESKKTIRGYTSFSNLQGNKTMLNIIINDYSALKSLSESLTSRWRIF